MQTGGVLDGWENRVRLISGRSGLRRLTDSFDRGHGESAQRDIARLLVGAQASPGGLGVHEISLYDTHRMTDRLLESHRALRVEIDEHRASTAPPPISAADSVTDAD